MPVSNASACEIGELVDIEQRHGAADKSAPNSHRDSGERLQQRRHVDAAKGRDRDRDTAGAGEEFGDRSSLTIRLSPGARLPHDAAIETRRCPASILIAKICVGVEARARQPHVDAGGADAGAVNGIAEGRARASGELDRAVQRIGRDRTGPCASTSKL